MTIDDAGNFDLFLALAEWPQGIAPNERTP
jgi:hypothetical protein